MPVVPRCLVVPLLGFILTATASRAQVPTPTIESVGSPAGAWIQPTIDPSRVDYVQEEYFISGTASAFSNVGPLGSDGMWTVTPAATAPYKTRILVYRPEKAKKFNGTVIVEWLNVSGGIDAGPDWTLMHTELVRAGYIW